jgi:hypothetical protein
MKRPSSSRLRALPALLCCATLAQTQTSSDCEHPPPPVYGDFQTMKALRIQAWRLFEQATGRERVFDSPRWVPKSDAYKPSGPEKREKGVDLFQAEELLSADLYTNKHGERIPQQPLTYESTFFNLAAVKHIRNQEYPLYSPSTTQSLLDSVRTDIPDFPGDSMVVKTFWRALPKEGSVPVGLWGWKGLPPNADPLFETANFPYNFPNGYACVELNPSPKSHCLQAKKSFFMTTVRQHGPDFSCANGFATSCPVDNLPPGQNLILLGMHIASKQRPDWLWATFWWRGDRDISGKPIPRTNGDSWTCDNAQRPPRLSKGVASNYSMDLTIGLDFRKPQVMEPYLAVCGTPMTIGKNEELLAAFNPFVEELMTKGRKSSCINCHSRADTRKDPDQNIPIPCDEGKPKLSDFEGNIRTDYLWSIRKFLAQTHSGSAPGKP